MKKILKKCSKMLDIPLRLEDNLGEKSKTRVIWRRKATGSQIEIASCLEVLDFKLTGNWVCLLKGFQIGSRRSDGSDGKRLKKGFSW